MSKQVWTLLLVLVFGSAPGCQGAENPDKSKGDGTLPIKTNNAEGAAAAKPAADAPEVTLEVKSWAEVQEWVKTQKGKVVVVDFWSTSCPPCIAEFPKFVALQDRYGDKIACASFSLDFTSSKGEPSPALVEQIQGILKKLSAATTTNFLSRQNDETVTAEVGVAAIPVAFIYDAEGNLHKKFTNDDGEYGKDGYTYEKDIYPVVEKLIKGE